MQVLIAGCGDTGCALARRLIADGHLVWGLKRQVGTLPSGVIPLAIDLTDTSSLDQFHHPVDGFVFVAAPSQRSESEYRAVYLTGLANVLALASRQERPPRFFFASSTGVYGQNDGSIVDETTATHPEGMSGSVMLEAEDLVLSSSLVATVIRFGGIYGPGRERMIRLARSGEPCRREPPHFTNRIHVEDAARVIHHLFGLATPLPLYIGVDDEPTPLFEVRQWLSRQMGFPPPPELNGPGNPTGKRCSNARLKASGFQFTYPTFREGYLNLIKN